MAPSTRRLALRGKGFTTSGSHARHTPLMQSTSQTGRDETISVWTVSSRRSQSFHGCSAATCGQRRSRQFVYMMSDIHIRNAGAEGRRPSERRIGTAGTFHHCDHPRPVQPRHTVDLARCCRRCRPSNTSHFGCLSKSPVSGHSRPERGLGIERFALSSICDAGFQVYGENCQNASSETPICCAIDLIERSACWLFKVAMSR